MAKSYLFIPGNTPSMLQHADVFESDALIIDLEDSVSLNKKVEARHLVVEYLEKFMPLQMDLYIRVNDPSTLYFEEDIAALDHFSFRGYVLPKADKKSVHLLEEKTNKEIIAIIESARSLVDIEEIATCKQVKGLLFGAEDYTTDMGIERSIDGEELIYPRSKIAVTAKAFEIVAIDTPFTLKEEDVLLTRDILRAKALGFFSKSAIHPNHVAKINELLAPSEELVLWAKRVIKKKEHTSKGAFSLDGKMVDEPIIKKAEQILKSIK